MSKQLLSIQKILHHLGIDGYYRPVGPDRHLSQLSIEIHTGENESNHLEICEIPIPDSELFLLQWFVQLPLSEPFAPNDPIPSFQQSEVLAFCAELNQILPIGIFNVFEERLCFRHIFLSEIISQNQVEYLLSTIETLIQRCQPLLQDVAIGMQVAEHAIQNMDSLFEAIESEEIEREEQEEHNDSTLEKPEELTPNSLTSKEDNLPVNIDEIAEQTLTIDEIAGQTLSIDEDDEWNLDSDFIVFDEPIDD